jgi:hypothetical protein
VLAFQDIEGFREAAGTRIAHEIIAQCSYKALLRLESDESAAWASKLLGQYETLQLMRTEGGMLQERRSVSEHIARRDAVLASEFYEIPTTSRSNGLTGFFVGPDVGAVRGTIPGERFDGIVTSSPVERQFAFRSRDDDQQWLSGWDESDENRLRLEYMPSSDHQAKALRFKSREVA